MDRGPPVHAKEKGVTEMVPAANEWKTYCLWPSARPSRRPSDGRRDGCQDSRHDGRQEVLRYKWRRRVPRGWVCERRIRSGNSPGRRVVWTGSTPGEILQDSCRDSPRRDALALDDKLGEHDPEDARKEAIVGVPEHLSGPKRRADLVQVGDSTGFGGGPRAVKAAVMRSRCFRRIRIRSMT